MVSFKYFNFVVVLLSFLPLVACASSVNMREAETHYQAATDFELKGDYQSAKDHYAKALVNAKLAKGQPALISMLTYNYGRMLGHTCQYDESEKYLLEALNIEKGVSGPNSGITSMRLFELARLNHDNNYYDKSVDYFDKAIPIAERLDVAKSDPIGYSLILEIYKNSLIENGQTGKAQSVEREIKQLKSNNSGKEPGFTPISYRCN